MYRDELPGACFQNTLVRFRPGPAVEPGFALAVFRFYLHSKRFQRLARWTVNIAHLGAARFAEVEFPLPPLSEQRRIIVRLDELFSDLDAGVAALRRARANLKCYRAAVLNAAVTGELTAEWRAAHPDVEPASKLLDRILAERRRKWEAEQEVKFTASGKPGPKGWQAKYPELNLPDTANLPSLPAVWCWARVEQLGEVQLGRQRSPKNRSNKYPTKYIRAANITESGLDLRDLLDMEFLPDEQESYRLREGDVLLSEASGSPDQVGKPAVWNGQVENCCFQNTVIRLRPERVSSRFLLVVFQHFYFNKVFAGVAAGVGINHLSAAKFRNLNIPLPPLAEQGIIVSEVDQKMSFIRAAEALIGTNLQRANRLRQSILQEAFTGRLVPQDPADEPASMLLDRIRQARAAVSRPARPRREQTTQPSLFEEPEA
jgi:type I restriction enzyme S subunit